MASHVSIVEQQDGGFASTGVPWDSRAAVDAQLEAMLRATSGALNWHAVRSVDAGKQWQALRDWVMWFRLEFGFDHRVVPPCWYRHAALVSVLSALRDHWLYAYDPMNTAVAACDWHRALIVVEQRLRDWAARTGCTTSMHRADTVAAYPDDAIDWAAHVQADVEAREWRESRTSTAAQLNETGRSTDG